MAYNHRVVENLSALTKIPELGKHEKLVLALDLLHQIGLTPGEFRIVNARMAPAAGPVFDNLLNILQNTDDLVQDLDPYILKTGDALRGHNWFVRQHQVYRQLRPAPVAPPIGYNQEAAANYDEVQQQIGGNYGEVYAQDAQADGADVAQVWVDEGVRIEDAMDAAGQLQRMRVAQYGEEQAQRRVMQVDIEANPAVNELVWREVAPARQYRADQADDGVIF